MEYAMDWQAWVVAAPTKGGAVLRVLTCLPPVVVIALAIAYTLICFTGTGH